ncbi:hypothetical protein SAMN05444157_2750 [Frankineae bacterium MT45]|nr:hypothetical protein SAMN05444157_2750 [Frankineae bacterium MT45]
MSLPSNRGRPTRFTTVDNIDTEAVPDWTTTMVKRADLAGESIPSAIAIAADYGAQLPIPGYGYTSTRWKILALAAQANLTVARVLETHCDALAILDEAGVADSVPADGAQGWGVCVGDTPGSDLTATEGPDGLRVTGTKAWCPLAGELGQALITAQVDDGSDTTGRRLFAVPLRVEGVRAEPAAIWVSRGLRTVTTGPVHFLQTPAQPIGAAGWFARRQGYAWGGMGSAACWFGGALALADTLRRSAVKRDDELTRLSVGTVDVALHAAAAALARAARLVDSGLADGRNGEVLALQVRGAVADAVENTLTQCAHTLGPAPLAFAEQHSRRVSDLSTYLRQHRAEQDLARLGGLLLADSA